MSVQFDALRSLAAANASTESGRSVREVGMQNRGPIIDRYLRAGGVSPATLNDPSASGADSRMWCGYFVYYCYLQASQNHSQPLPFTSHRRGKARAHYGPNVAGQGQHATEQTARWALNQ